MLGRPTFLSLTGNLILLLNYGIYFGRGYILGSIFGQSVFSSYTITLFSFLLFEHRGMRGILRYIVNALGGEWKRLTFCRLEEQLGVAASDSERPLEIEGRNCR